MNRVSDSGAIRSGLVPQLKHRAPPQGFPVVLSRAVRSPWRRDGQPSAVPGKCAPWRDVTGAAPALRRGRKPTGRPVAGAARRFVGAPGSIVSPSGRPSRTVMQALRLRQRRNLAQPPRTLAWLRAERVAMGVCGLPDLWEACIFRVARCTRGSERGWNPLAGAHHAARSVIRDPCELHCACRSVTESIPS